MVDASSSSKKMQRPVIQLFVKSLTGRVIVVNVTIMDSVRTLKAMIEREEGISSDEQRLVYAGKQLEDGRILLDYNIQRDSTIDLLLRARGGGKTELHRACEEGLSDVAIKLIENKATIDSVNKVGIKYRHRKMMATLNRY